MSLLNGVIEQVVTQAGDNDGDDALTSGTGDDILLGGGGSDTLNAGDGVNVLLGDEGTVSLQDGVIEQVVTQAGGNDGDDALTSGAGDDILLGGGGSDTLDAGEGVNALLGDEGTVSLQDGVIEQVVTQAGDNDGDDALTSGAGDDILLGGGGSDKLNAGDGVNALLGDEGTVSLQDGVIEQVVTQAGDNDGDDARLPARAMTSCSVAAVRIRWMPGTASTRSSVTRARSRCRTAWPLRSKPRRETMMATTPDLRRGR